MKKVIKHFTSVDGRRTVSIFTGGAASLNWLHKVVGGGRLKPYITHVGLASIFGTSTVPRSEVRRLHREAMAQGQLCFWLEFFNDPGVKILRLVSRQKEERYRREEHLPAACAGFLALPRASWEKMAGNLTYARDNAYYWLHPHLIEPLFAYLNGWLVSWQADEDGRRIGGGDWYITDESAEKAAAKAFPDICLTVPDPPGPMNTERRVCLRQASLF